MYLGSNFIAIRNKLVNNTNKHVLRLEFFCILNKIIDQAKPYRFVSTKVGPELEYKDGIWVFNLVHLSGEVNSPCFFQLKSFASELHFPSSFIVFLFLILLFYFGLSL